MTTQPEHAPGDNRSAGQLLLPLRDIATLVLVAAPAVMLFIGVLQLIPSGIGEQFTSRAQHSFYDFVNVATVGMPLLAVLLATLVRPSSPRAKTVVTIAMIEYAVAAVFAILFGILTGLIAIAGFSVRAAFEELLMRGAWLAVFGVAAYAVFKIWRTLYYVPRPKPVPGMYGQPQQYGQQGQQFGQPPQYGPQGQQFGQPQQYGPQGQQFGPQAQQFGQPQQFGPQGQPGQPYGQPAPGLWGQPAPTSAQPAPAQPTSAQPAPAQPDSPPGPFAPMPGHPQTPSAAGPYGAAPGYPSAPPAEPGTYGTAQSTGSPGTPPPDATRMEPPPGDDDRTEMINRDRHPYTGDQDQPQR